MKINKLSATHYISGKYFTAIPFARAAPDLFH